MQVRSSSPTTIIVFLSHLLFFLSLAVSQAAPPERSIDEIKTEAIHRAEVGQYPLIGLDPSDVRAALASVKTRDKDEWAP